MAGEPGEAMAHSAFDTILVLDFGSQYTHLYVTPESENQRRCCAGLGRAGNGPREPKGAQYPSPSSWT